ncbi:MAG: hypothetical protein M3Y72_12905 [Acidobacteriota bacterium]|nr:hypothetical protein [Acidobacteriota bacterium]
MDQLNSSAHSKSTARCSGSDDAGRPRVHPAADVHGAYKVSPNETLSIAVEQIALAQEHEAMIVAPLAMSTDLGPTLPTKVGPTWLD